MKYLMLFADYFEDTEAIACLDVLVRGKDEVLCASLMDSLFVKTKCGHEYKADSLINDIAIDQFDCLIIPGGPASFKLMPNLPIVTELINYFVDHKKAVASICAAPHLVGKLGYFKDKCFTVHPGFEDLIIGGKYLRDEGVVVDGLFITAKSMYYSIPFGLAIHEYFHGKDSRNNLEISLKGEK